MELGLEGKVAIVCAASQGLGRAAALGLAREGANLVICSRDEARIRTAAEGIAEAAARPPSKAAESAPPPVILPVAADLSRAGDTERLVQTALDHFGRIDILVNNCGGPPVAGFARLDDAAWEAGVQLTLMSTVRMIRLVLPHMQRRRWGRIITITSIAAKQPIHDLVISSTLRPGLLGLHKVLADRYGADGILINCVAPGFILTARQEEVSKSRSAERGISHAQYLEEAARDIPMRRLGRPEELADVIVFLASERSSYVNGATISVDGGLIRGLL
jgi:3-oxoacyl-[acyl-carrier protein] reductase